MKILAGLTMLGTLLIVHAFPVSALTVRSADIVNGEVKNVDLGANSVTTDKIMDLSVGTNDLANGAVTDIKISGTISASKVVQGEGSGLNADTIDGVHASGFAPVSHTHALVDMNGLNTMLADMDARMAALESQIAVLQDLLQHVSRAGNDIVISGANLRVVSGSGATDGVVNGLGNVIVGYNESRNDGTDNRNGSHNLVIGTKNNFMSYGGFVGGAENSTAGIYSTVGGGRFNATYGEYSSILGGAYNFTNTNQYGTVSGGYNNAAIGALSSVSGGSDNQAHGHYSSISGGDLNSTSGIFSSVSGGYNRHALGNEDWIAGDLWQDK